MAENSRREAIKAAITSVAFVPVAAATSSTAQSSEQSKTQDSQSNRSRTREKRPDAAMTSRAGKEPRIKFNELKSPSSASPVISGEEVQKFQAGVEKLKETLASAESLVGRLPATRLESKFCYVASAEDFSLIRCDSLASEASVLVGKCKQIRKEWDSAYETAYAFLSDLDRFNRLDAIFKMEEANGVYDLDSATSQADLQSANAATYPLANAAASIKAIYDDLNATFNDQYGWIQLLGWLSHISGYGQSGYATATVIWNGVKDEVVSYCQKAAEAQGLTQLRAESNELFSDYQSKKAQSDALNARLAGLQTRATWDIKNKQYRMLQVQTIRDLYKIKQQLADQPDGPFNFTERLAQLQLVFDSTFSDALARFKAIANGFSVLFGFDCPLPPEVLAAIQTQGQPPPSATVLDIASNWLDTIGRWYTRFLQHEQTSSVCLSLKDLVSHDAWHKFRSSGVLSVNVPETLFPQQYYVRCRAVGMYTLGVHGFCSASLRLPRDSYYIHSDQTKHTVNQSTTPLQRLCRVVPANHIKPTERVGMNTVFNCSPIGEWEISVAGRTSTGEERHHLKNLILEIIVVQQ